MQVGVNCTEIQFYSSYSPFSLLNKTITFSFYIFSKPSPLSSRFSPPPRDVKNKEKDLLSTTYTLSYLNQIQFSLSSFILLLVLLVLFLTHRGIGTKVDTIDSMRSYI